jgi:hypothetical protein
LGVGLLGAIVGGLAAREASGVAVRKHESKSSGGGGRRSPGQSKDQDKAMLISTLVGAVVGGLSANAIEKKVEQQVRKRNQHRQDSWERKFGKESDLPHYDTGDVREVDHERTRRHDDRSDDDDRPRSRRNRSEDGGSRYRN